MTKSVQYEKQQRNVLSFCFKVP